MAEFIIGAFLIATGVLGNAGLLLEALAADGPFIPFAAAIGILYWIWIESPAPERKPVRLIIGGLGVVIIVTQWTRLSAALSSAWASISSLNSGSIATPSSSSSSASSTSGGYGSLSAAQLQAESGDQQFTSTGAPLISSAGAVGVSQILPSTAQAIAAQYGIPYSLDQLENDETYNETLGSDYMSSLLKQFGGNQAVALAAYNAGPNNPGVQEYAQTGNGSNLPAATQAYLNTILGAGNW